jgi:AAA family ATP:ADP antiporter
MMGCGYGVLFFIMGLLLLHPTMGLSNANADPYRFLGWVSYVTIESFGSMVVQCYWALVNSSVDLQFAKKNFGLIVAGAQIGSILGPTLATQADVIGIPTLYLTGGLIMFLMVGAMHFYIQKFGAPGAEEEESKKKDPKKSGKEEGIMEGFYLFWEHDYVKGIFVVSSVYMVQVTIVDYMMKVLAKERYALMYPDDPQKAVRSFASFMGYFGQVRFKFIMNVPNFHTLALDHQLDLFPIFVVWYRNGYQKIWIDQYFDRFPCFITHLYCPSLDLA